MNKFFLIIISYSTIISCTNNNKFFPITYLNAVWLYNFNTFDNSSVINQLLNNNINAVFISINTELITNSNDYIDKFKNFVSISKQNNIQVHAMIYEDPYFTKTEYHNTALYQIDSILDYISNNPEYAIDGIHIDVEPHALPEWKNANDYNDGIRESLLQNFLSLLTKTRSKISNSKLKFSAAITWWYDSKYRDGVLPSGDTNLYSEILDFIVVMSYAQSTSIYNQGKDEMNTMPTVFGFYVPNYLNKSSLEQDIQNLFDNASSNNNFMGTCIFKFSDYSKEW